MIDAGRHAVLGVRVAAVDYDAVVDAVVRAAEAGTPLAVSALAVHGVMTGVRDPVHARRLNGLDLVLPDGQPVRWALRWRHGVSLPDRVYGPTLSLRVLAACAIHGLPVYFYGSREPVLAALVRNVLARFPELPVAGCEPSQFRRQDPEERRAVVERIRGSGARVCFTGLGCPRQEVWAFENRDALSMPILAVGAAFDFHAGTSLQAPAWMQRVGLEWAFRLACEPRRLWQRYLVLNPLFALFLFAEWAGLRRFEPALPDGSEPLELPG